MSLSFEEIQETEMEPLSGVYELQHGLFVQGKRSLSDMRQSARLRIIHLGRTGARIAPAPSSHKDFSPSRSTSTSTFASSSFEDLLNPSITQYQLGFNFADFNIDPEQDLAIYACLDDTQRLDDGIYGLPLVKTYIMIRRLSNNGAPHSLAALERLELGVAFQRGLSFYLQIFGDFVGILTRSISGLQLVRDTSEFLIYNWKTGVLQTVSCFKYFIDPSRTNHFTKVSY